VGFSFMSTRASTWQARALAGMRERDKAMEAEWQRRATAAAIKAARDIVSGGSFPSDTPIGQLSDARWDWLVAAILFGWMATKAEQAVSENLDTELVLRMTGLDPDPMDAGVIAAILPKLADVPGIDWSRPLYDWPRESMVAFLLAALRLVRRGEIARDTARHVVTRTKHDVAAREASAAAGGPLLAPDELTDAVLIG
jgi:hypothetical protein